MRILVTGGTGVIGAGVIPQLLRRAHAVRLLSRHAEEDAKQWQRVEPFGGDISEPHSLHGAAGACDAIIHIAGIATEKPPELTFDKINVGGTRNIIDEAKRAGVRRFIYISSLGADHGTSAYHRSKFAAEQIVERSGLNWTIVRPGSVYGPGDEVISTILKMVRSLPAVPMVDKGEHQFQPIWYEDLGHAIAAMLERDDTIHRTYDLAGSEITTMDDLIRRFSAITARKPMRLPVPMPLASIGAKIASAAIDMPVDDVKLTMLRENNTLPRNARPLADFGVEETPLDHGLRLLADAIPEVFPEDGIGAMHHKRFWADMKGSRLSAPVLMSYFRENVNDVMPIEFAAEPGAPARIFLGATMTGHLPLRGHFQIRVERDDPTRIVFATIEGHPIAGIVEFNTKAFDDGTVRFAIDVFSRVSNFFDFVAMKAGGEHAQAANWRTVVQRMIDTSGGTSDGVHQESITLGDEEAKAIEEQIRAMVQQRKREESSDAAERPS